jgi:hypothetical protein
MSNLGTLPEEIQGSVQATFSQAKFSQAKFSQAKFRRSFTMSVTSIASTIQQSFQPVLNRSLDRVQQINENTNDQVANNSRKNIQDTTSSPFVDIGAEIALNKGIGIDVSA